MAAMQGPHTETGDDIAAIASALECSLRAAQSLYAMGQPRIAPHAVTLVHQGDEADSNWLILDGNVRCEVLSPEGRNTVVATHPPGDLIGHFGRRPRAMSASLTTHGITRLLTVGTSQIERLGLADSDFALAVARSYARQSGTLLDRLAARISLTAVGRIHARLLEMAGPDHVIEPAPIVAALAVSVQTTRETASRAISNLERRGIIRREAGRLVIQSPRMLEELVV